MTVVRGTYQANIPELAIYAGLASHGFRPELLGARRSSYTDEEVGMPVHRLAPPPIRGWFSRTLAGGYLLGRLSPYRYFHEYLRGFQRAASGSAILLPTDLGHPTSFQCLALRPQAKVVVQVWDNIPFNWPMDRPLARHYEAVLEQADFFLPLTRDADRTLAIQGVRPERRAQVYPGVDPALYRPPTPEERRGARASLGAGEGEVVALFVGKVEFYKGVFTLLEAMAQGDRRLRLHVVGEGSARARAERLAARFGLTGRVRFWGAQPHRQLLPRFVWGSDLVVGPSVPTEQWREQFGQVFLEAMAAGVPVVASRTGGVPEVVADGVTGTLVAPDAPEELRSAMDRLAGDGELRRRLGEAGRRTVEERFHAARNAAALADVLWNRVLGRPRA